MSHTSVSQKIMNRMNASNRRLHIFTWHVHGSYLYYLSQGNYELYIPVNNERTEGYYGRGETFPFGPNVHEVDVNDVPLLDLDLILFQTTANYQQDQYDVLSPGQRELPKVYLQHDPPWGHPTDTVRIIHVVAGPSKQQPKECLFHYTVSSKTKTYWSEERAMSK